MKPAKKIEIASQRHEARRNRRCTILTDPRLSGNRLAARKRRGVIADRHLAREVPYWAGVKICFQSRFMSTTIQPRLGAAARATTSFPVLLGWAS